MACALSHGRVWDIPQRPQIRVTAVEPLRQRRDFLAAASAPSWAARGVVVQANRRGTELASSRIGFTVTRKIGNAVRRNRVKRRLREAVRLLPDNLLRSDTDYVFIGRKETHQRPFERLIDDMRYAIENLNDGKSQQRRPRNRNRVS